MDAANDADLVALSEASEGKRLASTAMARFHMVERCGLLLNKKAHQALFLEYGGCAIL